MTVIEEKLIDKVRKLIAKAENTDSQAESDAFMGKANALLLKHNLQMTQVESVEDATAIQQDKSCVETGGIKSEGKWEDNLVGVLARHNMCRIIIHGMTYSHKGTVSIIGKPENIETVKYLFEVSRNTIRRLSKKAYKSYRASVLREWNYEGYEERDLIQMGQLANRMPWCRNYLKGATAGLNAKLKEMKAAMLKEQGPSVENQFALMVVDNDKALEIFIADAYPKLGKARATVVNDASAYNQGKRDGKNINLNKGVSGASNAVPKQLNK